MKNNLEPYKVISFDDLIKHGLNNGANIVNGMPWSWKINGKSITYERDDVYLIETINGNKRFEKGDMLVIDFKGLYIQYYSCADTHAPGGCPM